MSSPEEIIEFLKPKIQAGLLDIADFVIDEADKWIPVNTGALSNSVDKRIKDDFTVLLVAGEGLKYAGVQYFGTKESQGYLPRHVLQGGKPIKLIDAVNVPGPTGGKSVNRYGRALREAEKQNKLKIMSGFSRQPRWFERVLVDPGFRQKLFRRFIKSLKRR